VHRTAGVGGHSHFCSMDDEDDNDALGASLERQHMLRSDAYAEAEAAAAWARRNPRFSPRRSKLVPPACIGLCAVLCALGCCVAACAGLVAVAVSAASHGGHVRVAAGPADAWAPFAAALGHVANRSARACRDGLYAHVCGRWDAGESSFADVAGGVRAQLRAIAGDSWPLVSTWYDACSNATARAAYGTTPLAPLLAAVAAVRDERSWARALAAVHATGIDAVFSVYADVDDAAPGTAPQLLYVDEAAPLLPLGVWRGNDTLAAAQRADLAARLGTLLAADDVARAMALDAAQLAPAVADAAAARMRDRRNIVPRGSLPGPFAWDAYWAARAVAVANVSLAAPVYVADTAALLAERNDWATLRAYLRARVVDALWPDLPAGAGADCLPSTVDAFGDMLAHLWVAQNFPANTTRPAVEAMVRGVVAAVGQRVATADWMDVPTRTAAAAKLAALHVMIGFPDAWDAAPPAFAVSRDNHLANTLAARQAAVGANVAAAGSMADRYRWLMPAFAVNAYYEPTSNDIVFPAGILRGAFYSPAAPLALNWGALGMVIGHEVTHGFDDQGRMYDASGARRDWWTATAAAAFERRAACIRALYDRLPGVNGALTLGENIADIGGLAVAHDAYFAALAAAYPTRRARHAYERDVRRVFGVTHEQLFYVGFARMWCASVPPAVAYERLLTDPHSPPRWRVDVPTSQSSTYARAFRCAAPPPDACVVW
jgi:putative endopeptidase